jgi:hypothetical protein
MAISGPIAPYSNVPIEAQFYQPSRFVISNVTLGTTTIVTTTVNHNYVVGQLVRLLIPPQYGCFQLNEKTGYVIRIPAANQVEVIIDSSTNVNSYIAATAPNSPEIIAVGDINSGPTNMGRTNNITYISGSFLNISPQ